MLEWVRFALCAVCLLCGLAALCTGVLGVFRFHYVLNRMHAAGMMDTLGTLGCMLGLAIAGGISFTSVKLILTVAVLWCTSPVSSHLIARLVIASDDDAGAHMEVREQ